MASTVVTSILNMHAEGLSFSEIARELTERTGRTFTRHAVRGLYVRNSYAAKTKKKAPAMSDAHRNSRILVISDMHHPYSHPDTVAFLAAIKSKYNPTRVICMGDEVDHHAMSFHDSDPDLYSAGDEIRAAIKALKPLYALFPVMDLMDSNHGSMLYRRGKAAGVPRKYLRDYGDVLEAPKDWKWQHDLLIRLPTGEDCYFHHGIASNVLKVVQQRGVCVVQGHYHTSFNIQYASNPRSLLWGMQVGCSIDKDQLAFAYDKNNLGRPIVGHGIIIDGQPRLLPMVLNKGGRWNKVVP